MLDPHSVFFDPGQFEQLKKMESSTQKGFGSVVSLLPGRVIVLQTLPGTPSAKAGLSPGDEILAINGYIVARARSGSAPGTAHALAPAPGAARRAAARLGAHHALRADARGVAIAQRGAGVLHRRGHRLHPRLAASMRIPPRRCQGRHRKARRRPPGGAGARFAQQSRGRGDRGARDRVAVSPARPEDLHGARPQRAGKIRIGRAGSPSRTVQAGDPDQRKDRQRLGNRHRRDAGSRPRHHHRRAQLRQGPGAKRLPLPRRTPAWRSPRRSTTPPADAPSRSLWTRRRFELAGATAHPNAQAEFHTDKGRKVTGGGGIQPDIVVLPAAMNRLRAVLEASASFTTFATDYLRENKVTADFEVTPADPRRVPCSSWRRAASSREWRSGRRSATSSPTASKPRFFNQAFGVEKGDEVEAQRDPAIQKALEVVGS